MRHRVDFIFKSVNQSFVGILAIVFIKPLIAFSSEIMQMIFVIRNIKSRKLAYTEFKIHIAHISNFLCIVDCFGVTCKHLTHFIFCFKIKFRSFELHSVAVIDCSVGLNTEKNIVNRAVLFFDIVTIVCCNNVNTDFTGNFYKAWNYPFLFLNSVVLKLYKKVLTPEYITVKFCL